MPHESPSRHFTWADAPRLHELNARIATARPGERLTHVGELYWVLRNTPPGDPLHAMRVWPAPDGSLRAAAWLDPPQSTDFLTAMDATGLMTDVLDWLERAAQDAGHTSLGMAAAGGDAARLAAVGARGYTRQDTGNVRFRHRSNAALSAAPLPDGFSLRHVAGARLVSERVAVESSAFGGDVQPRVWEQLARRLPNYRPGLDLIALDADEIGASACTCWYDDETRSGEIEAVGTAPRYRRRGAGKAVIVEGLRRLYALGAREVRLYSNIGNDASRALYVSCGFDVIAEDHTWSTTL